MTEERPKKSAMLLHLENAIDVAEKLYAIQHQALTQFFMGLTSHRPEMVKFQAPGTYSGFRPDLPITDVLSMAQLSLASDATGPVLLIGVSMDTYLANLGKAVYQHSTGLDMSKTDVTWYRQDMIETITGINPEDCVGHAHLMKLFRLTEQVRVPWSPTEHTNQDEFYAMIKGLKLFAEDYEIAIQAKWPQLRLEGI